MPRYTAAVVSIAATLWLLIQARSVLEPFLIALFLWFLLSAVASNWARLVRGPDAIPNRLERTLSAFLLILATVMLASMIASNAEQLRGQLPSYEANLDSLIASATQAVGLENTFHVGELLSKIDLSQIIVRAVGTATSFVSMLVIIIVYIIFIVMEIGAAPRKLDALFTSPERRGEIAGIVGRINHEIETYFGIKIVIGLIQAVPTYVILSVVGVDAAAFWAIVIFFFSFVPTLGSLIGIIFPSLMTLVQFGTFGPFLLVLGTVAVVQLAGSNYLEPRMMGKSLNLSPLAIFLAIFAGGALWGIVGALIVVPLLAVVVIVFTEVPSMRPVAILLSADGDIEGKATQAGQEKGQPG